MLFSVPQQARTTPSHLHFLGLAQFVALVLIWWAFIPSASRLAIELQHARPRLTNSLTKSNTARGHNCTPIFDLSPIWEKEFLVPSMARSTADALDIVCRLDRNDTLDEVPQNKEQTLATGLLLNKLHKQDFAGPLSSRASGALEPISRFRVADILPHMELVSRASRPGLLVGFLRILCNGLCTAQRFSLKSLITHAVLEAQMNLTRSHITVSVPGCTTNLLLSGDIPQHCHKEIVSYMT